MLKRHLISSLIGALLVLPVSAENLPDQLLWGDTHVHSNNSPDDYFLGNRQLTPAEAFAFARGEAVTVNDSDYKIGHPLDFLVVTDHAEYLCVFPNLDARNPALLKTDLCSRWIRYIDNNNYEAIFDEFVASLYTDEHRYSTSPGFERSVWHA